VDLPSLGLKDRKTLVILGAGATRGASFVAPDAAVPPPLDQDFFRVLQLSASGRSDEGRRLIEHVRTVYGPALNIGLETVFNNLDAARIFHEKFNVTRGRVLKEPRRLIDALRVVLPTLLGESISGFCTTHAAMAKRLYVGDAVISLNYDCVMDDALRQHAGFRFDPARGGYGVDVADGADHWRRHGKGKRAQGSIQLLKLHGSLNWRGPAVPLHLRADPYKVVANGVIAPPLTNKPVTEPPLNEIWRKARIVVGSMRRLIIVGYSMPSADGLVRTLLATDLSRRLEDIVFVEPDEDNLARHVDFFGRVAPKAKVITLRSMRQFESVL
jgi:SIR2-like domain